MGTETIHRPAPLKKTGPLSKGAGGYFDFEVYIGSLCRPQVWRFLPQEICGGFCICLAWTYELEVF